MVKYRNAILKPQKVLPFLRWRHEKTTPYVTELVGRGEFAGALYLLPSYVAKVNLFPKYLAKKADGEFVEITCNGHRMLVHHADVGIGQELYITGYHEKYATETYKRELRKIGDSVDRPTVLEVGANIGYYTLLTLTEVEDAFVYSVEPVPSNVDLLRKNVELNGYQDRVDVSQCAISGGDGVTQIHLSESSNFASIHSKGDPTRRKVDVETMTVQSLLDRKGLEPEDVNVVRMDIEGHESEFFLDSFRDFLEAVDPPFLFNFEIHPKYIDDETVRRMLRFLEDRFELVAGYQHSGSGRLVATVSSLSDVRDDELDWAELILRKKA